MVEFKDHIDEATFNQILEMDDDENEREFSKGIVIEFFTQAEATFEALEKAIQKEDLDNLSSLGHFLKGSSATLGLTKVQSACAAIQHLGAGLNESGTKPITDRRVSLTTIQKKFDVLKADYQQVKSVLDKFFGLKV